MIVRRDGVPVDGGTDEATRRLLYSDAGGLTQFGAYVETIEPGPRPLERHWHENEDEFLYVLSGEATVIENDGEHVLRPGDAACWKAGRDDAHQVVNRSDAPCTYLIFGTRVARDVVHYPDTNRTLYDEDGRWRLVRTDDGSLLGGGRIEQVRPMTWFESGPEGGSGEG